VKQQDASEGKIGRGWRLTKVAWTLIRHDRAMLSLAFLGVASAMVITVLVLYFGGYLSSSGHRSGNFGLIAVLAYYPSVLVSVFFNVALACAASAALDGETMSAGEAIRMAYGKRGRIALWSLITAVVGMIISEIASRLPGGAKLVGWLAGAAWGLATIFVVPILAMEGISPIAAAKRSAGMVRTRWGEGVTGNVAISAWAVVVTIPACFLLGIGAAMVGQQPGAGFALLAIGIIVIVAISTVVAATRQVFAVALYRYAIDAPIGGFSTADLENPFTGRKGGEKRKSWILRIGVPILALFAILAIIGALINRQAQPQTGAEGYWHLYFSKAKSTTFAIGAPVVADGHQIGSIVALVGSGSSVSVGFHIDTAYNSLVQSEPAFATGPRAHQYLCFGTRRECGRGSPSKPILQLDPPIT
jgi:hypothetical protein